MTRRAMRSRRGRLVHAVPADLPVLVTECERSAQGWVYSDDVPDCPRCLRKLANTEGAA